MHFTLNAPIVSRPARVALTLACTALVGCNHVPDGSLRLVPDTGQNRQMQTRLFGEVSETEMLSAVAAALQDMGFVLDDSETKLGVITASKGCGDPATIQRMSAAKLVLTVIVAAGLVAFVASNPGVLAGGMIGGSQGTPAQPEQIRTTVVINPAGTNHRGLSVIRITFERQNAEKSGQGTRIVSGEPLNTPALLDEFFGKLAQNLGREPQTT